MPRNHYSEQPSHDQIEAKMRSSTISLNLAVSPDYLDESGCCHFAHQHNKGHKDVREFEGAIRRLDDAR